MVFDLIKVFTRLRRTARFLSAAWRLLLPLGAGFAVPALTAQADGLTRPGATDQLIVHLRDTGGPRIAAAPADPVAGLTLPDGTPLTFVRRLDSGALVVRLPAKVSQARAEALVAALSQNPSVEAAQVDRRFYPALVPNDPQYARQWHLFEDTAGIRLQDAWDRETGSADVVIAVIDTGILPHAELASARILPGYDFISDVFTANDGDGRDPDPVDAGDAVLAGECDAATNDPPADKPSSWHGLLVTGIMAATADNGSDIAGVNFASRILPLRVLGKCGGQVSDIIAAIRWAAGLPVSGVPANPTPARVINLSLAGAGNCSREEQDAINDAVAAGALVVVAAGNDGRDAASYSPANCANVMVVGALARDGSRASYTNVGSVVDLVAPGGDGPADTDDILSLWNDGVTTAGADILASTQGTSFTTAQVSGVAALMWAVNSTLEPGQVHDILRLTTRDFPDASCNTSLCGTGLLDASAALAGAADPTSVLPASIAGGGGGGGGCTLGAETATDPLLLWLALIAALALRREKREGR